MEDILFKTQKLIKNVERRPHMYLHLKPQELIYEAIANYWIGYFSGLEQTSQIDINSQLNTWIQSKRKTSSSLIWTFYIYHILAKKDDKKACKIIFKILKEFFDYYEAKLTEEKKIG
jgi:hypothetical protein